MKVHYFEQRTQEWFDIKQGKMSASNAANLIGTPAAFDKYVKKTAFQILKKPQDAEEEEYLPRSMQRGVDWEDWAYAELEKYLGQGIRVGFIEITDHFGISPDFILDNFSVAGEIKVMEDELMAMTLIDRKIPMKYFPQVLSYFLIDGVEKVVFCGFCPGLETVNSKSIVKFIEVTKDMLVGEVSVVSSVKKGDMYVQEALDELRYNIKKAGNLIEEYRKRL